MNKQVKEILKTYWSVENDFVPEANYLTVYNEKFVNYYKYEIGVMMELLGSEKYTTENVVVYYKCQPLIIIANNDSKKWYKCDISECRKIIEVYRPQNNDFWGELTYFLKASAMVGLIHLFFNI